MPRNTSAKILADSFFDGSRLTTFEVECPHHVWVHLLTHRSLSRNARSNRAIPTAKLIEMANYTPEKWFYAQKGMQPGEEIKDSNLIRGAWASWSLARANAIETAKTLSFEQHSKETVNRLLEPFSLVKGVVTADHESWKAVFKLRCHPDAQWETRELFEEIRGLLEENEPDVLDLGEAHLPYVTEQEKLIMCDSGPHDPLMLSAARCARVSYGGFDGTSTPEQDEALAQKLLEAGHWSPFEHQAEACRFSYPDDKTNFPPQWHQWRKELERVEVIDA